MGVGRALWTTASGVVELLPTQFATPDGWVEIEAMFGGISRGTEALVHRGAVPESEWERMRCPLQEGSFPFPVKYGYASVGVVRSPDPELLDATVFVLHPHQDLYAAPASMAVPVPPTTPASRAILGANMETALNIVWDARPAPGDRVAVVGAGVVGALAAYLCTGLPGAEVTLVDVNEERGAVARALGCGFATPANAPAECDVVIHASTSAEGLATAIACAGFEARIVEASWYGDGSIPVALGGDFHARRLRVVSSQVGHVPAGRRARWSTRRRLEKALALLADDRLDVLVSGETAFSDLPDAYGRILADPSTLCHRIVY